MHIRKLSLFCIGILLGTCFSTLSFGAETGGKYVPPPGTNLLSWTLNLEIQCLPSGPKTHPEMSPMFYLADVPIGDPRGFVVYDNSDPTGGTDEMKVQGTEVFLRPSPDS